MSDIADRIRKQAEEHNAKLLGKQKSEENEARLAAEKRKVLEEGAQGVWDEFAREFLEAAEAVKTRYPNELISLYTGSREVGIEKAKDPSVRINCSRTSDRRISILGTLGLLGGFPQTLHQDLLIKIDDSKRLYLQDSQRPNLKTTASDEIDGVMGIVIKSCGTQ